MLLVCTLLTGCTGSKVAELKNIPLEDSLTEYEIRDYYAESLSYDTLTRRTGVVHRTQYELVDVDKDTEGKVLNYLGNVEVELSGVNTGTLVKPEIHTYFKYIVDDKVLTRKDAKVQEAVGHYFVDVTYSYKGGATGSFGAGANYLGVQGAFVDRGGSVVLDQGLIDATASKVGVSTVARSNYAGIRYPSINTTDYNKVNGSIVTNLPATPSVTQVYNVPNNGLGGYCLYPEGAYSLKEFGFDRGSLNGEVTLRYIFEKQVGSNDVVGLKNLYIMDLKSDVKIEEDEGIKVAEFVETEADKLVERYDRVVINGDASGLMNGLVVEDMGLAARTLLLGKNVNRQKHSRTVDIVNSKDTYYLLKFETLIQEGLKGDTNLGTHTLDGYMVMQQIEDRFALTDYLVTGITLTDEPNLDTDSDIQKRLVSLGLKNEVTEKVQGEVKEALSNLYKSGTERNLKGLKSAFNSNTELLSSVDRNYMVTKLQDYLTVYGGKVESVYSGVVSEWLGGTDEQVELVVTELVDYQSRSTGIVTEVYYLMSKYKGVWVIDEKDILASKNISSAELDDIRKSIESGKSVQIKDPDNQLITTKVGNNDAEDGKDLDFTIDEKGNVVTEVTSNTVEDDLEVTQETTVTQEDE